MLKVSLFHSQKSKNKSSTFNNSIGVEEEPQIESQKVADKVPQTSDLLENMSLAEASKYIYSFKVQEEIHFSNWDKTDKTYLNLKSLHKVSDNQPIDNEINAEEVSGNFEGDMVLSESQQKSLTNNKTKAGLINTFYNWPGGVVYYEIASGVFSKFLVNNKTLKIILLILIILQLKIDWIWSRTLCILLNITLVCDF
jgi:hypothetical protein